MQVDCFKASESDMLSDIVMSTGCGDKNFWSGRVSLYLLRADYQAVGFNGKRQDFHWNWVARVW